MVKTPNRAVIPPMNRPNPEMGVEVPKKQIKKDNKYQFEKAEKIEAFILSISY